MKLNRELNLNELEKVAGGAYDENSFYKFITKPCRIRKTKYLTGHIICSCPAELVVHVAGPVIYNSSEGTTWYPVDLPLHGYVLANEVVPCDASEY